MSRCTLRCTIARCTLSLSLSPSLSPIATVAFEVWQTTVVLEARGASGFRDVTGGQLPRRNGAWRVCRVCERRRTHFTLCHSHTKNLKQCSVFLSHKQERRHTQTTKYMAATTAGSVRTALCFGHGAAPPAWKNNVHPGFPQFLSRYLHQHPMRAGTLGADCQSRLI